MMNVKEIRAKGATELVALLAGFRRQQFQLRAQRVLGQLGHSHKLQEIRKEIARVKTILNEKNLSAGPK